MSLRNWGLGQGTQKNTEMAEGTLPGPGDCPDGPPFRSWLHHVLKAGRGLGSRSLRPLYVVFLTLGQERGGGRIWPRILNSEAALEMAVGYSEVQGEP